MDQQAQVQAQGGGYGPPGGGGYGQPPPGGGGYGQPPGGGGYGQPPGGGGYAPPPAVPPGGYGAPPGQPGAPMAGGMPGAPGGAGGPPDLQAYVSKWFTLSIVSIFCGCGLLGIINVLMANQAKQALAAGDTTTAMAKIKTARMLCIIGYVVLALGVVGGIGYTVLMALVLHR